MSQQSLNDPEIELLIPEKDVEAPELTICVPALNEALTIGEFVDWCHEGIRSAGVIGEILIIDSSTDKTAEIAVSKGARVLKTPKRGLGRAYIDALGYVRGKYIILGDCDCTYDFRQIKPFIERFREGNEFIMGSRFRGYIEPGAMPPLHQYLGTPVTTWILNIIYSSQFTDIHCGMRGVTKNAFLKMDLRSQSWEYASEMVLKSVHLRLRTVEVPIRFLKDKEGRLSHHKREGWFSPWKAAWINLKAMFIYGPDFFLFKPGILLLTVGSILVFGLSLGPVRFGPITLSLYWMLLGLTLSVVGIQSIYMGILAGFIFNYEGTRRGKWMNVFSYNRTVLASLVMGFVGSVLLVPLVLSYVRNGLSLPAVDQSSHLAILGIFFLIAAFITFTFTLLLHATDIYTKNVQGKSNDI